MPCRFNVTFYTADPPGIHFSAEQLTVLTSEVEGVRPGDKLVSINGDSVVGEALADMLARLRQAFTKNILRCTPTHCQITKVQLCRAWHGRRRLCACVCVCVCTNMCAHI